MAAEAGGAAQGTAGATIDQGWPQVLAEVSAAEMVVEVLADAVVAQSPVDGRPRMVEQVLVGAAAAALLLPVAEAELVPVGGACALRQQSHRSRLVWSSVRGRHHTLRVPTHCCRTAWSRAVRS